MIRIILLYLFLPQIEMLTNQQMSWIPKFKKIFPSLECHLKISDKEKYNISTKLFKSLFKENMPCQLERSTTFDDTMIQYGKLFKININIHLTSVLIFGGQDLEDVVNITGTIGINEEYLFFNSTSLELFEVFESPSKPNYRQSLIFLNHDGDTNRFVI